MAPRVPCFRGYRIMYDAISKRSRTRWGTGIFILASVVLIVGVLYWGCEVLIPIALAVLATFLLSPIVTAFRRRGLGRVPAVVTTVLIAFGAIAAVGTLLFGQFQSLANELPAYRENVRAKIADLRLASRGGAIEKEETPAPGKEAAVPVVIQAQESPVESGLPLVSTILEPLATAGIVIVLTVFMLLRREDLRDRILRLAGFGHLAATTRALDETGRQVSRYLFRQCILNASFGVFVGTGLWLLGLPYALLWGFLAGVARFVPYIGPWLGAAAPILLSLAVFDNWTSPLMIVGMIIGLELINNLILEPILYGQSIGVSEVALLIMIVFWTWLWGPIGMVLAAPMTVCLMVICKNIPDLEFIALLLSSKPALDPHHLLYQRLLAKDEQEAGEVLSAYLKNHSPAEACENLLFPTLIACRRDAETSRLDDREREFVLSQLASMVDRIRVSSTDVEGTAPEDTSTSRPLVLCIPASDEFDEIAVSMVASLLPDPDWKVSFLSHEHLVSEKMEEIERAQPALICVGCLAGAALYPVRQLCKRLRARQEGRPILVGVWGVEDRDRAQAQLADVAHATTFTAEETRSQAIRLVLSSAGSTAAPSQAPDNARAGAAAPATALVG
jgi:predicted PurR-regulated permease PerM